MQNGRTTSPSYDARDGLGRPSYEGVLDGDHPLDWVVIGAASNGPRTFLPDPEHVRRLLEVLDATGTPVFFKGNLRRLFVRHDLGTLELNRWREDFPYRYHDGTLIEAVAARQVACRALAESQAVNMRPIAFHHRRLLAFSPQPLFASSPHRVMRG